MSATSKTLVVKQGKPSASGEVVDTSKAKVIPPSPEVKAEAGKRDPDPVKKVAAKIEADAKAKTEQIKNANAESLRRDEEDRKEAVLEMADDAEAASEGHKYKKPATKKSIGNGSGPVARLTAVWLGKDGKDVLVKDRVRTAEGIVIDVIGRWTRKAKNGNVPMVTGHIVSLPTGKNTTDDKSKGRKIGDRQNAIAQGCTHAK